MSTNRAIDQGESNVLADIRSAATYVKSIDDAPKNEATKLQERYRICASLMNIVSVYDEDGGQYGFDENTIARAAAKKAAGDKPSSDKSSLIKDARADQKAKKAAHEEAEKAFRKDLKQWNDYLRLPYTAPGMSARVVAARARQWEQMQAARQARR